MLDYGMLGSNLEPRKGEEMDMHEERYAMACLAAEARLRELFVVGGTDLYEETFSNGYGVCVFVASKLEDIKLYLYAVGQDGELDCEATHRLGASPSLTIRECAEKMLIIWLQNKTNLTS